MSLGKAHIIDEKIEIPGLIIKEKKTICFIETPDCKNSRNVGKINEQHLHFFFQEKFQKIIDSLFYFKSDWTYDIFFKSDWTFDTFKLLIKYLSDIHIKNINYQILIDGYYETLPFYIKIFKEHLKEINEFLN